MKRIVYAIILTATTLLAPMILKAQPVASFTASPLTGCAPVTVTFHNTSTGATSYLWDFGDGATSTSASTSVGHTYNSAGYHTVTLTAYDGSGDSSVVIDSALVFVATTPVAAFRADPGSDTILACAPHTVCFKNLSIPVTTYSSFVWDFGDGSPTTTTTDTSTEPCHTYIHPGTYAVTLVVNDSGGCTGLAVRSNYIHIDTVAHLAFTDSISQTCTYPATVYFHNSSTASTYHWDFGDSHTSTAVSPTHTYSTGGTFTVTLVGYTAAGCPDTLRHTVFVDTFKASFTGPSYICVGSISSSFTSTSTYSSVYGADSYLWDFGDAHTATTGTIVHTWYAAGTYTVKLVVTHAGDGCKDSTTHTVTIGGGPTVSFTPNNIYNCSDTTVCFTNTSSVTGHQYWSFPGASPTSSTATDPCPTFSSVGVYTVTLYDTDSHGCFSYAFTTVTIGPPDFSITATPDSGCTPLTVHWSTSLPGVSYIVDSVSYGDGHRFHADSTSGTHTYDSSYVTEHAADSFHLKVCYHLGTACHYCDSITIKASSVHPIDTPLASVDSVCQNQVIDFASNCSNCTGWLWKYSGGTDSTDTFSHSFSTPGTYTVSFIGDVRGCLDTVSLPNIFVKGPNPGISITLPDCSDRDSLYFTNTSTGSPTTWIWNFGDTASDSNTSTSYSVGHRFSGPGLYTVTLTDSSWHTRCSTSKQVTVNIYNMTDSIKAVDTVTCVGDTVKFSGASVPNTGKAYADYYWFWGDGTSDTVTTVKTTHVYSASGVYTVKLIDKDSYGCYDTVTRSNYIRVAGPTIAFTGDTAGCYPFAATLVDVSTDLSGVSIVSHEWSWGDGSAVDSSGSATGSHTYDSIGTFKLAIKDSDSYGCVTIDSFTIISAKPHAYFTVNFPSACPLLPLQFTDTTTADSFWWSFGDAGTSTLQNPTHAYSDTGSYTVTLIVEYGHCYDTMVRTDYVTLDTFTADFTISPDTIAACPPLGVDLTPLIPSDPGYTLYTYGWNFGHPYDAPGTYTSTYPTTHATYAFAGDYTITEYVTNVTNGCQDSAKHMVHVSGPSADYSITPDIGCAPLTVSMVATTNASSIVWIVDGSTTYTHTVTDGRDSFAYTYHAAGVYHPTFIITSGTCSVPYADTDSVVVNNISGNMFFSPDNFCTSGMVTFLDTVYSSTADSPYTYLYKFGDSASSTADTSDPRHYYATPGTYTAMAIIGNSDGCYDTITRHVHVLQNPTVSIVDTSFTICSNDTIPVTLIAGGTFIDSYSWSPTTSCATCDTTTALPAVTTVYTVLAKNSDGCKDTAYAHINVLPAPVLSITPDVTICHGDTTTLVVSGVGFGGHYSWDSFPHPHLFCDTCSTTMANPTSTVTYIVDGIAANGCSDTAKETVTVLPQPTLDVTGRDQICYGDKDTLSVTSVGGDGIFTWTGPAGGTTLSCTTCDTTMASPAVTTIYTVSTHGTNGCWDSVTKKVTVNPLPVIPPIYDSICYGTTVQLVASGAIKYYWEPSTDLSCDSCINPISSTMTSIVYTVVGTDAHGCIDSNIADITVVDSVHHEVIPRFDTLCVGNSVQLLAIGGTEYYWSPSDGLDNTNIPNPIAKPDTTTTYVVTIVENGCFTFHDTALVVVNPVPTVLLPQNTTIIAGSSLQIISTVPNDTVSYAWQPENSGLSCYTCPDPIATPSVTTTYTVAVTTKSGCTAQNSITITLKCDNSQVFVPNTFTPNGDGVNDRFYISAKGVNTIKKIAIFNRWGEQVFEQENFPPNDARYGWDGTFKGQNLEPDVFVYVIQAECEIGGLLEYKGDISIVR